MSAKNILLPVSISTPLAKTSFTTLHERKTLAAGKTLIFQLPFHPQTWYRFFIQSNYERVVMQKVIRKFHSFAEAEEAEYAEYRALSGNEKLQILLELIMPENPDAAIIERCARVHRLTEHEEC